MLTWFSSFLLNRYQRVVVNGSKSSWSDVISGVPQGTVLGSLPFLRYINDITGVTGIGIGTIYGYVKEIMIIIIASQDGIVR